MNMKVLCALTVLLMFGFSECGYSCQDSFNDEVKEINKQHALESIRLTSADIKRYAPTVNEFEVGFTADELESMTEYKIWKTAASRITYEEAAADVDLFYRVLRNCYGGYFYFGGDEAFERAKENVLSDCVAAGEKLSVGILRQSLKKNLKFIKDGHFRIDNEPVIEKTVYYSNEETVFLKDVKGYYTEQNGKRNYLSMVDGSYEIEKYMKRSINDEGMLVYRLGMLSVDNRETVDIIFENKTEKVTLSPPKIEIYNTNNATYYSQYEAGGIPVVTMGSFMYGQDAIKFVRSADTIKNSEVSILDIRGNCGGMAKYVVDWLNVYDPVLSEYASGNIYVSRVSRAADYLKYKNIAQYLSNQETEELLSNYRSGRNGWEIKEAAAFSRRGNSNFLFVLVDSQTFSAGEWIIAALRNKDNVIFVGTNSGGGLMSDSSIKIVLPNSKVNIQCGSGLGFYYDDTVFTEETGFLPDMWVNTDAMKHTLNLISYYGL